MLRVLKHWKAGGGLGAPGGGGEGGGAGGDPAGVEVRGDFR